MCKQDEQKRVRELIDSIKAKLAGLPPAAENDEWLRALYEGKTTRFLAENDKIWVTGRIFITVSLGAFAAWAALGPTNWVTVLVLGGLSVSLLLVWHLVASAHRWFQTEHQAWVDAIEEFKNFEVRSNLPKPASIETLRKWLIAIVAMAWTILIFLTLAKIIP